MLLMLFCLSFPMKNGENKCENFIFEIEKIDTLPYIETFGFMRVYAKKYDSEDGMTYIFTSHIDSSTLHNYKGILKKGDLVELCIYKHSSKKVIKKLKEPFKNRFNNHCEYLNFISDSNVGKFDCSFSTNSLNGINYRLLNSAK